MCVCVCERERERERESLTVHAASHQHGWLVRVPVFGLDGEEGVAPRLHMLLE